MTIILGGDILNIEPILPSRLPEIKRTQQVLMFLNSVILIICFISFMLVIYSLSIKHQTNVTELIIILFWILFFALGMFSTDRYDDNGLFIFACLGNINIIFTCIIIVYKTIRFIILTTEVSPQMTKGHVTIIPIYTCLIGVILQAIIVILAFKLSYLITKNKPNHQQI